MFTNLNMLAQKVIVAGDNECKFRLQQKQRGYK
jgi:hypothetical protein